MTFEQELSELIKRRCLENNSGTPDFILAQYLHSCLVAFNDATRAREQWHGRPDTDPKAEAPINRSCINCANFKKWDVCVLWQCSNTKLHVWTARADGGE